MNKELKSKFPEWVNNKLRGEFSLCLGDDLDSLLSCVLLSHIKGYPINHFYDFESIYTADLQDNREVVSVDIAKHGFGKAWCNHVTLLRADDEPNPDSANANNIMGISCEQGYKGKYALSTSLLICAYYGFFPTSERAKMLLLTVDTAYKGHYNNDFKEIHTEWMLKLGLDNLLEVLERHTLDEFRQLEQYYQLWRHIKVEDGRLVTGLDLPAISRALGINLQLPMFHFNKVKQFRRYKFGIERYLQSKAVGTSDKEPFTLAATTKRQVCFSM